MMWKLLMLYGVWSTFGRCSDAVQMCQNVVVAEMKTYSNCQTVLENGHLKVTCFRRYPINIQQSDTDELLVNLVFEAVDEVSTTPEENVTVCFKMTLGRVARIISSVDQYNSESQPYNLFFRLQLRSDVDVGLLTYNSTCVRSLGAENEITDVAQCAHTVRGLTDTALPSTLTNQTLLTTVNDLVNSWLKVFNGTVEIATLTQHFARTKHNVNHDNDTFTEYLSNPNFPTLQNISNTLNFSLLSHHNVQSLEFSLNEIGVLENDAFPVMRSVTKLDLTQCHLRSIESDAFRQLPNLEYLDLSYNHLQQLPTALSALFKLKKLFISTNFILYHKIVEFNFAPNILGTLTQLETLDLSGMKLVSSENEQTPALKHLKILDLSSSFLNSFPEALKDMIPNVETLILSDNNLRVDDIITLFECNWNQLQSLDLSGNQLSQQIDFNLFFKHFPKLKTLNLTNNGIRTFSPLNLTTSDETPKFINLSRNDIRTWNGTDINLADNVNGFNATSGVWNYDLKWSDPADHCLKTDSGTSVNYKNCRTELADNNTRLSILCELMALGTSLSSVLFVDTTFKTITNLILDSTESNVTDCIQLATNRVWKGSSVTDQNVRSSNYVHRLNEYVDYFMQLSQTLDLRVKFHSDAIVGFVNYDLSCVLDRISMDTKVVSECVHMVTLFDDNLDPLQSYQSFENVPLNQAIWNFLFHLHKFWALSFDGVPHSLTLTFKEKVPTILNVSKLSQMKLKTLSLPNNGFEYLRDGDIPSIPTLTALDLNDCQLRVVEEGAFNLVPNLTFLNLAGNQLMQLPEALSALPKLEFLKIDRNLKNVNTSGFHFTTDVLRNLTRLRSLDMSQMKLIIATETDPTYSTSLEHLQVLNLSETVLDDFPLNLKGWIPNVETLILSDNNLRVTDLPSLLEHEWNELQTLDLSGNQLGEKTDFSSLFVRFPKLNKLNLAENGIRAFSPLNFPPNIVDETPKFINLSQNGVKTWNGTDLNLEGNLNGVNITSGVWNYELQWRKTVAACAKSDENEKEVLDNCTAELVDNNRYLQIKCDAFALAENVYSLMLNNSFGLFMGSTFKTTVQYQKNAEGTNSTDCLQVVSSQLKKTHEIELWNRHHRLDQTTTVLITTFTKLELNVRYNSDAIVGSVTYDATCVRNKVDAGQTLVSECLDAVTLFNSFANVVNPYSVDTQSKNFWDFLLYLNKYKLIQLNGVVRDLRMEFEQDLSVPPDMSAMTQSQIEVLYLPNNGFVQLKKITFSFTPTLRVLDLSGCVLNDIESDAFSQLPNLVQLNLAGNRLQRLPESLFTLSKLQVLNISSNHRHGAHSEFYLTPRDVAKLSRLTVLDASGMKLTSMTENNVTVDDGTDILERLKVLNLSSSHGDFPEHLKRMIPNVETLILSANNFTADDVNLIVNNDWTALQTLDLSGNEFKHEMDLSLYFQKFPKLQKLNLANNNISSFFLTLHITENVTHRFINLSNNHVTAWYVSKLEIAPNSILEIDLTNNKISEVSGEMLTDFSKLQQLYLAGMKFDCGSCSLEQFQDWLKRNETLNDFDTSPYTCAFPIESSGKVITSIELDPDLCVFNWLLKVVVPLLTLTVTAVVVGALVHHYRWHLRYFWFLFRAKMATRKGAAHGPLYRYDAFVSYCSADDDWVVRQLIPAVEQQQPELHLCIHERDFALGDTIINNVIDCIDSSRKSIFVISRQFINSTWCQWELQMAQHKLFEEKNDVLVLIMLEELTENDIPRVLKRLMSTRTYLIWPDPDNVPACKLFWSRLRQCIGQCHCSQKQQVYEQSTECMQDVLLKEM